MGKSRIEEVVTQPTIPGFFNWRTFDPSTLPGGINANLARELVTYRDRLDELLDGHEGEYVVIKGDEIIGYHAEREDALKSAFDKFGTEPALTKKVMEQEPLLYLNRVV
jgi:hypothetical protein